MKTSILLSLFILLFFQIGNGQTEPLLQKYTRSSNNGPGTDFWKTAERENFYDLQNNLIRRILKGYTGAGEMLYWQGSFYEYDTNNRLKKCTSKRYNPDVDLWITNFWIDYKYDPNGCRIEEATTANIGGMVTRKVTYTRNEHCQMTSELTEWRPNGIDLVPKDLFVREYHSDGKSYDEKFYQQYLSSDSLRLSSLRKSIFDENENILEEHQTNLNSDQDTLSYNKLIYDYDEFQNVTLTTSYSKYEYNSDWKLKRKRFHHNEYDENGFLIRKEMEQWEYDEPNPPTENLYYRQSFVYRNSCEGINEEYTVNLGNTGKDVRYEFVYQGINECLDLEKIDLHISISPNPSNGEIEITSPVFQTGNTDILVFGTDGKVLLQKNESSRCESSSIDLTSMQNGIYILQLQNGKHFVNEKIVIAK